MYENIDHIVGSLKKVARVCFRRCKLVCWLQMVDLRIISNVGIMELSDAIWCYKCEWI